MKKSNTANDSGFESLGKALPSHRGRFSVFYFVLKNGELAKTANAEGYLGMYAAGSIAIADGSSTYYFASGNSSSLIWSNTGGQSKYQALSTTVDPWQE